MEEIRNRIITLSGEPVSGKSTILKELVKIYQKNGLNVHIISAGEVFRKVAIEEYKKEHPELEKVNLADVQSDKTFSEKLKEIDNNLDKYIGEAGEKINLEKRENDVYIVDSRLAWNTIPKSYAVRLTVNEKIAGERVFKDKTRGEEDKYKNIEQAIEKTRERKLSEIERYKKTYGVNLTDNENYDLIIDSSYAIAEQLAKIVKDGEEAYRNKKEYPKYWASPLHFVSTQQVGGTCNPQPIGGYTIEELAQNIKKNGYMPNEGQIAIIENNGTKFVSEGNHRIMAALANGLTVVPYKTIERDTENTNRYAKNATRENGSIEHNGDYMDLLEYYGWKIGKIEAYKNLKIDKLLSKACQDFSERLKKEREAR